LVSLSFKYFDYFLFSLSLAFLLQIDTSLKPPNWQVRGNHPPKPVIRQLDSIIQTKRFQDNSKHSLPSSGTHPGKAALAGSNVVKCRESSLSQSILF
jgi:hypothetical protein